MHTHISQLAFFVSATAGTAERLSGFFGWFFYCHPHEEQAVR